MTHLIGLALLVQVAVSPQQRVEADVGSMAWAAELTESVKRQLTPFWYAGMPAFGLPITQLRYNRIEALSIAGTAGIELRDNYSASALLRVGIADLVPNAELVLRRDADSRRVEVAAYHRLSTANIWGRPLAFGPSLGALLIGRDEGLFYRTGGIELRMVDSSIFPFAFEGRLFGERHRQARVKNDFSFADMFGERDFNGNIRATHGDVAGAEVIVGVRTGDLVDEFRFFGEVRLEAGMGDFDYTRGMIEGAVYLPLPAQLLGSLLLAAGGSGAPPPPQRAFYLGGTRSLRGQRPGAASGDTFWMTQVELSTRGVFARPVIFFDAGWAGASANFSRPGRVATGVGIGGSFFDGSLRFDLARGLYPGNAWRGALYLEAR